MLWVELVLEQLLQKCHACFPLHFRSINNAEHHPEPLSVDVHHQPQQRCYKMVGLGVGGIVGFTILVGATRLLQKNSRRDPPPLDPLDPDMRSSSIRLPPPPLDLGMRSNSLGLPPQFPGYPPPPIPINPNLVKLSMYTSKGRHRVDIGVIVSSNDQFVTVLGRAYFIYDYKISDGGPRKLHQGKVTVVLQGNKLYLDGPSFQAHVVHVDFSHHVAVLKFACSRQFSTVDFCSSCDMSFGQQLLSFVIGASHHYFHEVHTVRDVPNDGVCGGFFHVTAQTESGYPGVFVLEGKLIGFRMSHCPQDGSLLHGLLFECCIENLKLFKNLSVDVRGSLPKADVNIGVLAPLSENEKEADLGLMLCDMKAEMGIMRTCMEAFLTLMHCDMKVEMGIMQACMEEIISSQIQLPSRDMCGNDKEADTGLMLREMKAEVGVMQMRMEEIISSQRQLLSSNMRETKSCCQEI